MSIFTEYSDMILKGLKNPKQVFEGIMNELDAENLPQDVKEEIARRRILCAGCPFMSKNAEKLMNKKFQRIEEFCTLCSCPIKTKTASLTSSCGAETYNQTHPENPQEIKWTAYDKESKG